MHAYATLLVTEHLNDLLREAADERRRRLLGSPDRSDRPRFGLARRLGALARRLRDAFRRGGRAAPRRPAMA